MSGQISIAANVGGTVEISEIESLAKGTIIAGDGSGAPATLAAGSNDLPLIADSAQATGLKYAALPIAGGGTGQVTAALARTTGLGFPAAWSVRQLRCHRSPLLGAGTFLLVEDTAYWVYMGYAMEALTVKHVEFHVGTGGTGAQTAEVAVASSPAAPSKAGQTLTKIAADGTLSDLTSTGLMRNTSAMSAAVPAGTHWWVGIRTAMATNEPTLAALTRDYSHGYILSTATAGALTGAGPWTGALVTHAITAQGPDLVAVLD